MFKLLKTVFKTGDATTKYPFKPYQAALGGFELGAQGGVLLLELGDALVALGDRLGALRTVGLGTTRGIPGLGRAYRDFPFRPN